MNIYADEFGMSLVFKDEADLSKVIEHLQDLREWKKKNPDRWPAVYTTYHDTIPAALAEAHSDRAAGR
jgi:hypothetical protein